MSCFLPARNRRPRLGAQDFESSAVYQFRQRQVGNNRIEYRRVRIERVDGGFWRTSAYHLAITAILKFLIVLK